MIDDGWAVIAEDEEAAQAVVDATGEGTLADDPEFQELTAAAGSAGHRRPCTPPPRRASTSPTRWAG